MRKVFSLFLITILLTNGAGVYIYFYFRLVEIKKQMQIEIAHTSPGSFQKITLTQADYNQQKVGDDEIEWNNTMYDIGSINFTGDQVEILALKDELETELLAFARGVVEITTDTKTPPPSLLQYLTLTFTVPNFECDSSVKFIAHVVHNTCYHAQSANHFETVTAPPPRV